MKISKAVVVIFAGFLLTAWGIRSCLDDRRANPPKAITVAQLMRSGRYDRTVNVYGKMTQLGKVNSPSFLLSSAGSSVRVWYDMMVEDNGDVRSPAEMGPVKNGDEVIVRGQLKREGKHRTTDSFWAETVRRPTRVVTDDTGK